MVLLITGCSVESKLNRSYKGKSFTETIDKMGAPNNTENLVGGGTIRSYVKKQILKELGEKVGMDKIKEVKEKMKIDIQLKKLDEKEFKKFIKECEK